MFANGCSSKTNNPFQAYGCRFLLRPEGREERGKLIFNNHRFLFACRHQKRQAQKIEHIQLSNFLLNVLIVKM